VLLLGGIWKWGRGESVTLWFFWLIREGVVFGRLWKRSRKMVRNTNIFLPKKMGIKKFLGRKEMYTTVGPYPRKGRG